MNPRSVDVLRTAAGLLDGSDRESTSPEYVRALVEMVIDLLGWHSLFSKEQVAVLLWAMAEV